jgi:hypothetical protein
MAPQTLPRILIGIALLVSACGADDAEPPIPQVDDARNAALLLVNDASQLSSSDAALEDRLTRSGYEVHLANSASDWIEQDQHVDVVVVGPNSERSDCGKLAKSNSPIIALDADCMHDLQMARVSNVGEPGPAEVSLLVEHPLAAGLVGTQQIERERSPVATLTLGEGATRIASKPSDSESPVIFAYETGAAVIKKNAPARRFGWLAGSAEHFTIEGWQLFDAAVRWAAAPRALLLIEGADPTAAEEAILARLRDPLGFQAEARSIADDTASVVDDARRARLVILSHAANGDSLARDLQSLRVPIVTMEPSALGALEMLARGEDPKVGTLALQRALLIQATDHVLAADAIQEERELSTSPMSVGWAMARNEAIVLASVLGALERASVFGLERIEIPDSTLPARRFAFLVGPNAANSFTSDGWALFDRSMRWTARLFDPLEVCMGRPDGASCADDDPCNGVETCQAERCEAGPADTTLAICEEDESPEVQFGDDAISLVASHACVPDSEVALEGAEVETEDAIAFQLPKTLRVRLGNAGNETGRLRYRNDAGETVTCIYRGAAPVAHPTSAIDIAMGREYRFESCSNEARPGQTLESTWFALDLDGSDCEPAPWTTEVEVQLGLGNCGGILPDPISAVDSMITRENFRWADTNPVGEFDELGRPKLYSALIYIQSDEERGFLDDLLIHHSLMPIFNSERSRYAGQCGSIEFEGDGEGLFVHAILPGVTYNLLRKAALTPKFETGDQEVFRVIKLTRPQDIGASNLDGSLSYASLGASGFRYMHLDALAESGPQSQFLSGLIRDVVNTVAEAARGTVREVLSTLGTISVFLGVDAVPLYIELDVLNRDPGFDRTEHLASGWNDGKDIALRGVRVEVSQRIGGVVPVLFYSYTDAEGHVADLTVAKDRTVQSICIAAQNDAAEVTSFVTETMVCGYANSGYSGLGQVEIKTQAGSDPFESVLGSIKPGQLTFLTIESDNRFLHLLALLSDSYDYVRTVIGKTPTSIEVLKGYTANKIGSFNGGAAFVPCFGHSTASLDTAIAAFALSVRVGVSLVLGPVAGAVAGTGVAAVMYAAAAAVAVDMILPSNGDSTTFHSRGVAVHEYGHVVFCDLLYKANEGGLYTEMMLSRIESGQAGTPDAHLAYVNEAFADFFFGQVAGAANYYTPSAKNVEEEGAAKWCVAAERVTTDPETACFDNNLKGKSSFNDQVGRVASTLHDGFDGHPGQRPNFPNNAAMWVDDGTGNLTYGAGYLANSFDEAVAMKGPCINKVVENFANRSSNMRGDLRLLAAMSDAMENPSCSEGRTPTWCDRCVLFANHDDGLQASASRQEKYEQCTSGDLSTIVGPAPVGNVLSLNSSCEACPTGFRTTDGVDCFFDPPIDCPPSAPIPVFDEIEQFWSCIQDCRDGFIFQNGQCLALID